MKHTTTSQNFLNQKILFRILIVGIICLALFGCANKTDSKQNESSTKPSSAQQSQNEQNSDDKLKNENEKSKTDAKEEHGKHDVQNKKEETDTQSAAQSDSQSDAQAQDQYLIYDQKYKQAARKYKKHYQEILSKYDHFFSNPTQKENLSEDMVGMLQTYGLQESSAIDESLHWKIGYDIIDLNGDETPELMIGNIEEADGFYYARYLHALYTMENDKPKLLFSSKFQNSYYYLGNGKFSQNHMSGSANQMIATFEMDKQSSELQYIERYFKQSKEENSDEISYYKMTGSDSQESQQVKITEQEFNEALDNINGQIKRVRLAPFANYHEKSFFEFDSTQVFSDYSTPEEVEYVNDYDSFNADDGDAVKVTFTSNSMTRDFKILSLKASQAKGKENTNYEIEEIYHMEVLDPNRPLIAGLPFNESFPNNGLSYLNEDGTVVMFSIKISERDKSICLQQMEVPK